MFLYYFIQRMKLLFIFCSLPLMPACNPYHEPIIINPKEEIKTSTQCVLARDQRILIPSGWNVYKIDRDRAGLPITVMIEKKDHRGQVATLQFNNRDNLPSSWPKENELDKLNTSIHNNVKYKIYRRNDPSGDDSPGRYIVSAYIETDGRFWDMTAEFLSPVDPSLKSAIFYIDLLQTNKKMQ